MTRGEIIKGLYRGYDCTEDECLEDGCDDCIELMLDEYEKRIIADGVRDFAEWLSNTEYVTSQGHFILPLRGYFTIDDVVSEWEKGQK